MAKYLRLSDFIIEDNKWIINEEVYIRAKKDKNYNSILKYKNPLEILSNIYRVLLSRGRKGMLLYIPSTKDLNCTYEFFKSIGIKEIQ